MWKGSWFVTRKPRYFYIVRKRKDDSIVAVGTAEECVKIMGLASINSFRSIVAKNRSGTHTTYEIDIEKYDEEDEAC